MRETLRIFPYEQYIVGIYMGALKMQDRKMQNWNLTDQLAGLENAGLEFADQIARLENAGLEFDGPNSRAGKFRTGI